MRRLYNSIIKVSFHYSIFSHSNLHLPLPILLFPFLLHVLKISQSSIEVSFLLINNLYTKKNIYILDNLLIKCVESHSSFNTLTHTEYWMVKWWVFFWHHKCWTQLLQCNFTKFTLVDVTVAVLLIGCYYQDGTGILKYKSHFQTWQDILK